MNETQTTQKSTGTLAFNRHDSFAIWHVPTTDLTKKSIAEREKLFKESYQEETFPMSQLPENLSDYVQQLSYVLVGLNPGNDGVETSVSSNFLNFHGKKASCDTRLATAIYETPVWGALITDLVHVTKSDSYQVKATAEEVLQLENHLDDLGISSSAVLISIGNASYDALTKYSKRPVEKISHYSSFNSGHWSTETTHHQLQKIASQNQ